MMMKGLKKVSTLTLGFVVKMLVKFIRVGQFARFLGQGHETKAIAENWVTIPSFLVAFLVKTFKAFPNGSTVMWSCLSLVNPTSDPFLLLGKIEAPCFQAGYS